MNHIIEIFKNRFYETSIKRALAGKDIDAINKTLNETTDINAILYHIDYDSNHDAIRFVDDLVSGAKSKLDNHKVDRYNYSHIWQSQAIDDGLVSSAN